MELDARSFRWSVLTKQSHARSTAADSLE